MAVFNKVKQITEVKIPALVLMARAADKTDDVAIAKWIIAASPYWRSEGYHRIREEMDKIITVDI